MYNILIIDDEKNIRMMLEKCLESEGYGVTTAEDGFKGIELSQSSKYDIILLDMKMPGLSGIDVLGKLKETNHAIPVIMMTAYGTIESAVEAMKLGVADYIRKPFTPDIIRTVVKTVLDRISLSSADTVDYESCLQYAKKCITGRDYKQARTYLMKSMSFEVNSPEVYNLLGVLEEYSLNIHEAQKFYRMALCIDYTFEPANKNLERTARFSYTSKGIQLGNLENDHTENTAV
jgi:Response regulator containing CheY-like receiver, AAA-type ATPase, and DNA-binding domains